MIAEKPESRAAAAPTASGMGGDVDF